MQKFPNFMVVGGVKCGTTSLYYYLKSHPELCVPCKESYLFTPKHNWRLKSHAKIYTERDYLDMFSAQTKETTVAAGEVASVYLYCHEEVIPAINRILGDVKIIIILRNPVERAYSHFSFFARDVRETRTFEEAVDQELTPNGRAGLSGGSKYVEMGFYANQVRAYLKNFSSVKVILFEEFIHQPQRVMSDIFEFLGADPSKFGSAKKIYNSSGTPKNKWLQRLFFRPTPWKMRLRNFLVEHLIDEEKFAGLMEAARALNLKKQNPIAGDMRRRLRDLYLDDITALEDLIGRDLSAWKDL